jgi:hypothetical protein
MGFPPERSGKSFLTALSASDPDILHAETPTNPNGPRRDHESDRRMNALKADAKLAEHTGTYTLGISHQTKKYMFGSNVLCPETQRFLLRKLQRMLPPLVKPFC